MLLSTRTEAKCVYMAPTKALCSERFRDWSSKFESLGVRCCELTGDSVNLSKNIWGDAKHSNIIITTSEKWDSLTRHWHEKDAVLAEIKLFMVDEVHTLNDSRGSTMEVVISRMKTRLNSLRLIMASATIPNIDDIAEWVGIGNTSTTGKQAARVFQFGEEFRPCKLTRHVYGIPHYPNQSHWQFLKTLDRKLFNILQQHAAQKPILIFVSSRKGKPNFCRIYANLPC